MITLLKHSSRFPRLEQCAHFHYDFCDENLASLSLSLAPAQEDDNGGEADARRFRIATTGAFSLKREEKCYRWVIYPTELQPESVLYPLK